MLCGGKVEEATRALEISSGVAWLVGNYEDYRLLEALIAAILHKEHNSMDVRPKTPGSPHQIGRFVAFSPAMDNVNSKMNRFGVPPQNYMRALLHRSILFAEGMVVPPNTITNSTVFIDEILFQGELDQLNEVYIQHIFPVLPAALKGHPRKLQRCRETRGKLYIFESVHEEHITQLDNYFDNPANVHQILYYEEPSLSRDYGRYLRTLLDPHQRTVTVEHLTRLWNNIEEGRHWDTMPEDVDRSSIAIQVAQDLADSLFFLFRHLPEAVFRSPLYKFADLFDEASDRESIIQFLVKDTSEDATLQLLQARDRIIDKPWIYGPFCHELFDTPYRTNLAFDCASRAENDTFIFLEEDEVPSWEFMSIVCQSKDSPTNFSTSAISAANHKYSSLLLSQTPGPTLLKTRDELAPIRAKIYSGSALSEGDIGRMKSTMASFESRSLVLPEVEITGLIDLDPDIKEPAKRLLAQCIFLVRKGLPLDPMYEEAQVTLPGVLVLRRDKAH